MRHLEGRQWPPGDSGAEEAWAISGFFFLADSSSFSFAVWVLRTPAPCTCSYRCVQAQKPLALSFFSFITNHKVLWLIILSICFICRPTQFSIQCGSGKPYVSDTRYSPYPVLFLPTGQQRTGIWYKRAHKPQIASPNRGHFIVSFWVGPQKGKLKLNYLKIKMVSISPCRFLILHGHCHQLDARPATLSLKDSFTLHTQIKYCS